MQAHRKAQAKTGAAPQHVARAFGGLLAQAAQMVGRHQAQRGRAQDALTQQFAAIAQALHKARVVLRGGRQAHAAGFHARHHAQINQCHGCAAIRIVGKRLGNAVLLVGRHAKAGVHHAQRPQDVFLQIGTQGLAANGLHKGAQQIGGAAIGPNAAGLKLQGHLGQRA